MTAPPKRARGHRFACLREDIATAVAVEAGKRSWDYTGFHVNARRKRHARIALRIGIFKGEGIWLTEPQEPVSIGALGRGGKAKSESRKRNGWLESQRQTFPINYTTGTINMEIRRDRRR